MLSNQEGPKIRIVVLWTELSGYFSACLKALEETGNVDLLVFQIARDSSQKYFHAYDKQIFSWITDLQTLTSGSMHQSSMLLKKIAEFEPQVAIVCGWRQPVYRLVAKKLKSQKVHVIGTADNQWRGTLRQWVGIVTAPLFLHRMFDALWVPGSRSATFARRLGFRESKLLTGLYSCDWDSFHSIGSWRLRQSIEVGWPRRFLFTGRLSSEKGIRDLLCAYEKYYHSTKYPWELWCVGDGSMKSELESIDGIKLFGFVQPEDYQMLLKEVGVFILPSHFEPWGLVIHEAMASGLPVVCTKECGAAIELIEEHQNGNLIEVGDTDHLAKILLAFSENPEKAKIMGERSKISSNKYTPLKWSNGLLCHLKHNSLI